MSDLKFTKINERAYDVTPELRGNNLHGKYIFYNASFLKRFYIEREGQDKVLLELTYQNGHFFEYNDFDYPSNAFELYSDNHLNFFADLYKLGAGEIEAETEDAKHIKSLIETLIGEITFTQLFEIYEFLCDERPSVFDCITDGLDDEETLMKEIYAVDFGSGSLCFFDTIEDSLDYQDKHAEDDSNDDYKYGEYITILEARKRGFNGNFDS